MSFIFLCLFLFVSPLQLRVHTWRTAILVYHGTTEKEARNVVDITFLPLPVTPAKTLE